MLAYKRILSTLLFVVLSLPTWAGKDGELYDDTKNIVKSFPAGPETSLEIVNKYGQVILNSWDKDSVRVEIEVRAEASKYSTVAKLMDMVDFNFSNSTSWILIETEWGQNVSAFRRGTMDVMRELGNNQKISIDYVVYAPRKIKLTIENKFGDVFLAEETGDLRLDLSHGDLRAKVIDNAKKLTVKYGKAKVREVTKGELDIQYSDLVIEKAGELNIKSISSELHIEEVNELNIDGRHDKYFIGTIGRILGEISLTDMKILNLLTNIDLATKYGEVNILETSNELSGVNFSGTSTDYTIVFGEELGYTFDISLEKGKGLSYPTDQTVITVDNEKGDFRTVQGSHNQGAANVASIRIKAKSSYIKFSFFN